MAVIAGAMSRYVDDAADLSGSGHSEEEEPEDGDGSDLEGFINDDSSSSAASSSAQEGENSDRDMDSEDDEDEPLLNVAGPVSSADDDAPLLHFEARDSTDRVAQTKSKDGDSDDGKSDASAQRSSGRRNSTAFSDSDSEGGLRRHRTQSGKEGHLSTGNARQRRKARRARSASTDGDVMAMEERVDPQSSGKSMQNTGDPLYLNRYFCAVACT